RVGDCSVLDGPRSKAACPRVSALRAELGNAERKAQLESSLAALQSTGAPAATDKAADPGARALSVYLAALGLVLPDRLLTDWLTIVPVLALELGAALSLVLVQSVSAAQPAQQIAPVVELSADNRATDQPATPQTARLDSKSPVSKPKTASKARRPQRYAKRRLGHSATVSKADAEKKVVQLVQDSGGKLQASSARGIAKLIGGKKNTGHSAVAGLITAGVLAKAGGGVVLAA